MLHYPDALQDGIGLGMEAVQQSAVRDARRLVGSYSTEAPDTGYLAEEEHIYRMRDTVQGEQEKGCACGQLHTASKESATSSTHKRVVRRLKSEKLT